MFGAAKTTESTGKWNCTQQEVLLALANLIPGSSAGGDVALQMMLQYVFLQA